MLGGQGEAIGGHPALREWPVSASSGSQAGQGEMSDGGSRGGQDPALPGSVPPDPSSRCQVQPHILPHSPAAPGPSQQPHTLHPRHRVGEGPLHRAGLQGKALCCLHATISPPPSPCVPSAQVTLGHLPGGPPAPSQLLSLRSHSWFEAGAALHTWLESMGQPARSHHQPQGKVCRLEGPWAAQRVTQGWALMVKDDSSL